MPFLMLKDLPRYECLLKAAGRFPTLNPAAFDAFLNLLRTGDDVSAAEHRFLAGHHISPGRFTVLTLLHRSFKQSCTPAELAGESNVTRATMTGLIDTLERDGLVSRSADPDDRRTLHIVLTSRGQKFIEKLLPEYFRCVSAITEQLDASEQRELVLLLQKIQRGPSLRQGRDTERVPAET
jgi:DNA-binding MarR family transcriptional regulator